MDYYDLKRQALILAKQAEIEAMKIENIIRVQKDESPAYSASDFMDAAGDLENLAHVNDEQL